jgi:AbrB family looped-hinge helix DNA binding protein
MTVTLKPKTEITVPRSIRQKAGIKPGDKFEFQVSGHTISIVPKRSADELQDQQETRHPKVHGKIRTVDHDDTLTPDEAKLVRRGEAQLKRGESKPWRDVKHALSR